MKKNLFYRFLRLTLRNIVLWFLARIEGADNIPAKGPFVIVANHVSYIDPLIIKGAFDKYYDKTVFYLAKKEVFNNTFKKYFFYSVGAIPVDREKGGKTALDVVLEHLKEGYSIGIFPEGTRSRDGKLHKGKTGAARLALSARCPILPIGVVNSYELWPPHKKIPKFRKRVVLKIGKPFTLEKYYNKKINKKMLEKLTDDIMLKIKGLSGQEYVKNN